MTPPTGAPTEPMGDETEIVEVPKITEREEKPDEIIEDVPEIGQERLQEIEESAELDALFEAIDELGAVEASSEEDKRAASELIEGVIQTKGTQIYQKELKPDQVEPTSDVAKNGELVTIATLKRIQAIRQAIAPKLFTETAGQTNAKTKILNGVALLVGYYLPINVSEQQTAPAELLKQYSNPTTPEIENALTRAMDGYKITILDTLPDDLQHQTDKENKIITFSSSSLDKSPLTSSELRAIIDDEVSKTIYSEDASEGEGTSNLTEENLAKAEAAGIKKEDLLFYFKYPKKNNYALARTLAEIEAQPEQTDSTPVLKALIRKAKDIRKAAGVDSTKNYEIDKAIQDSPRFSRLEQHFIEFDKITVFLEMEGLSIESLIDMDDMGDLESGDDGGSDSTEGGGGEESLGNTGPTKEKSTGKGGGAGGSRKSSVPANFGAAIKGVLDGAYSDWGQDFNPFWSFFN